MQLAIDTILVFSMQDDGEPTRGAGRCPKLVQPGARARLVVLGLEVGGRWSKARVFVQLLGCARARSEPQVTQSRIGQAQGGPGVSPGGLNPPPPLPSLGGLTGVSRGSLGVSLGGLLGGGSRGGGGGSPGGPSEFKPSLLLITLKQRPIQANAVLGHRVGGGEPRTS